MRGIVQRSAYGTFYSYERLSGANIGRVYGPAPARAYALVNGLADDGPGPAPAPGPSLPYPQTETAA